MDEKSEGPQRSGSRWEPGPDEQPTEVLAGPAEPLVTPAAQPQPKRGMSTAVLAAIVIVASSLFGAGVGLAIANQRAAEKVVSTNQTVPDAGGQGLSPDGGQGVAPYGDQGAAPYGDQGAAPYGDQGAAPYGDQGADRQGLGPLADGHRGGFDDDHDGGF